jgi:hypothetical protein
LQRGVGLRRASLTMVAMVYGRLPLPEDARGLFFSQDSASRASATNNKLKIATLFMGNPSQ